MVSGNKDIADSPLRFAQALRGGTETTLEIIDNTHLIR